MLKNSQNRVPKQLATAVQVLRTKKDLKSYTVHLLGSMKCDITFLI